MGNTLEVQKGKGSFSFFLLNRKVEGLLEERNYCSFQCYKSMGELQLEDWGREIIGCI